MKLSKKLKMSFILLALSTSCSIPNTSGEKAQNHFSIKSTINPDQIKKNFLNKTILKNTSILLVDSKSFNFTVTNSDLKRKFALNLINGLDTNNNINRLLITVNGKIILKPFDIPDFDNKGSFKEIYQQVCKEDKINKNNLSQCLKDILQGAFNKNTKNLSINLDNLKEGNNTIQFQLLGTKGSSLGFKIDGFMQPLDIPNAVYSNIPDTPEIRSYKHTPGRLGIKFLEGMKVRLIDNPDGTQKLIDLNGTSLTQLERLMSQFGAKLIYRPIDAPPEMFDRDEIKAEEVFGTDVPNENLFYYINFPEDVNVWSLVDTVRQMPFIEEGFPDFIPTLSSFCTEKTSSNPNDCQLAENARFDELDDNKMPENIYVDKSDWMKRIHVMPNDIDKGAWLYTKGKPEVKVATIDGAFQSSAVHPKFTTNEDFDKKENFEVIKNTNIDQEIIKKPDFNDFSHNTAVSGIIGARGNNSKGVAGIAYNSSLLSIVGIDAGDPLCKGSQLLGSTKGECDAIADSLSLATSKGAKVVSISVGSNATPEQLYPAVRAEIVRAVALGTVVVIATGNGSPSGGADLSGKVPVVKNQKTGETEIKFIPDTGSIVVGGLKYDPKKPMDAIDTNTVYDNGFPYGVSKGRSSSSGTANLFTEGGHATDVSAPVRYIWTTYPHSDSKDLLAKPLDYGFFGGVSAGVPMVASTAALMLSENPDLTPFEVRKILRETRGQTTGKPIAGMLNAYKAVQEARKNKILSLGDYKEVIGKVFDDFLAEEKNMIKGDNDLLTYVTGDIGVQLASNVEKGDILSVNAGGLPVHIKGTYGSLIVFGIIATTYLPTSKDITIQTTKGDLVIKNAIEIVTSQNQQNKVVFNTDKDGITQIYSMNEDGTDKKQLTLNGNNYLYAPNQTDFISPDGKKVLFTSTRDGEGRAEIYIMNIDGSNQTKLTNFNQGWADTASWSPDGTKIAFIGLDNSNKIDIFVANADGSNAVNVTANTKSDLRIFHHTWSPDSKKIAFISDKDDYPSVRFHIYSVNIDGSALTKLTSGNYSTECLAWSPDGTKIAFDSNKGTDTSEPIGIGIFVINPDGSNMKRLTYNSWRKYYSEPIWSPDGSKISFSADNYNSYSSDPYDIFQVNPDGSGLINLTNNDSTISAYNGGYIGRTHWSADSKKILYPAIKNNFRQVFLVNTDGSGQSQLTNDEFNNDYPAFSLKSLNNKSSFYNRLSSKPRLKLLKEE